jgi:serine/threonine protein kinase
MSYNGWEKIEQIGSGGQSEVWLVRSPERVRQRSQVLKTLENGVRTEPELLMSYEFARPEKPSELGALKIFKFRDNSGDPIKRLKREIDILKEGKYDLPKLLDANAGERWMVTEYFPNKTLADHLPTYKGRVVDSLDKFRGLVETIASLHADGVVHRDIKPSNIFVADDGRLIPGDFGLLYSANESERLTLPDERVGPWQHLPWWANLPERVENPSPAIDVFLLGSLLWVMVSGRPWLHGDQYKHPSFDLERMFRFDRQMRLVNLILSQCLGSDVNFCLKDATELLRVIEEVVATLMHGAPILDENKNLLIPCQVCNKGFYNRMEKTAPKPERLQHFVTLHNEMKAQEFPMSVDVFTCSFCTNVQYFGGGQPFEALTKTFQKRVNPNPNIKGRAW